MVLSTRAPRVIFEQNEGYLLAGRQGLRREEIFARYPLSHDDYTRSQQLKMVNLQWMRNVVADKLSPHFRYAELSFQIVFWLLTLPGITILLWKSRTRLVPLSPTPQGLLLLFCFVQIGVSFFLVYASYQRATLDMIWLLTGLGGWAILKSER